MWPPGPCVVIRMIGWQEWRGRRFKKMTIIWRFFPSLPINAWISHDWSHHEPLHRNQFVRTFIKGWYSSSSEKQKERQQKEIWEPQLQLVLLPYIHSLNIIQSKRKFSPWSPQGRTPTVKSLFFSFLSESMRRRGAAGDFSGNKVKPLTSHSSWTRRARTLWCSIKREVYLEARLEFDLVSWKNSTGVDPLSDFEGGWHGMEMMMNRTLRKKSAIHNSKNVGWDLCLDSVKKTLICINFISVMWFAFIPVAAILCSYNWSAGMLAL